jgi:OPA family glycerol-3-phosphate transporter-like MFS transporter
MEALLHPPGFRARRAQNWVFLGLMYGFFYMSRYNFSAIAARLSDTFGWSNTQYSDVLSWGTLIYGLSVFLNGPLADRLGGKRAILIGSAGAAVFNLLFGLCHIFLATPATVVKGTVVTQAVYDHGMNGATMLATFSALWAANHYFQSFGALSIVKINAAWFPVRERGVFAGIFGIMIQSGRWLAFAISPLLLSFLPWQWCFWVPAGILAVMWGANRLFVENSPKEAGFPDLDTGDESKEEAATASTLTFVLKKVFASPTMWLFALSSMCIGFVRNSIDHWWAKYMPAVFGSSSSLPHQIDSFAMPAFAILGGLAAGTASDKLFGSRRAPVVFVAFVGQAVCLALLAQCYQIWWAACALLALVSFFIQSSHSIIGGAASMDFGGKKAVATAAGLFDGAQYLAGAVVARVMGHLLDRWKEAGHPGVEYRYWPLVPIPFALVGAILVSRLWNARPVRAKQPESIVAAENAPGKISSAG